MPVYLYAVCHGEMDASTCTGLGGESLRAIGAGELSALVGDQVPSECGEAEMWQHESAIEELMGSHDLLPARFGTVLSSDAAVQTLLTRRSHDLSSALRRIAGASELSVRALWSEVRTETPRSGAEYLQSRAETERRADALTRTLESRLAPMSRARRRHLSSSPEMPVTAAYLVARDMTSAFAAELDRLDREIADATLLCTGPWPPYSFVDWGEAQHA